MTLIKNALLEIAFITPLLCFVLASSYEFRARRGGGPRKPPLVAPTLGVILAVLLLIPFHLTPQGSVTLSKAMVVLSLLVASSGLFVRYESTITKAFVPLGGIVLAFFWFFNRIVV
jgi:hypothetical protein